MVSGRAAGDYCVTEEMEVFCDSKDLLIHVKDGELQSEIVKRNWRGGQRVMKRCYFLS